MIVYCVKSILCLGVLWSFFRLFLEKERIHNFKRFYLIFSILTALILPVITLTYEKEVLIEPITPIAQSTYQNVGISAKPTIPSEANTYVQTPNVLPYLLWSIYIIGVLIFGYRYCNNINRILRQIRRHNKISETSHNIVLLKKPTVPYTFLNYIFVYETAFNNHNIPHEILTHEKIHVLQKHTWDILFIEITQVFFWFNPMFIFLKKSIRLNHEFLADQGVLKQEFTLSKYLQLLVNYPVSSNQTALSSPLNYSLTKKRLQMMTTHFSTKRVVLKMCALLLILPGCMLFFNNQIIAKEIIKELPQKHVKTLEVVQDNAQKTSSSFKTTTANEAIIQNAAIVQTEQDSISKKRFNSYKKWVEKMRNGVKKGRIRTSKEELYSMRATYESMSSKQQNQVASFSEIQDLIPTPPAIKTQIANLKPPVPPVPPTPVTVITKFPAPPTPPKAPSPQELEVLMETEETIQEEVELAMEEMEAQIEAQMEESMEAMEDAQIEALETIVAQEQSNTTAMERAYESRKRAQEARARAMEARRRALENAKVARVEALQEAKKRKLQLRAEALTERAHAIEEARAAHFRHKKTRHNGSLHMLMRLDQKKTEFFYKGKPITREKALEIVENAENNLSLDIKTKNNFTKVKIKD